MPKILIVDNNEGILKLLRIRFEKDGYAVVQAKNGVEALAKVDEAHPDLIITDILMPKMDGFELCRRLKASEKTSYIPIVMISTLPQKEYELLAFDLGAEDYLVKPFNLAILSKRVRAILKRTGSLPFKSVEEDLRTNTVFYQLFLGQ